MTARGGNKPYASRDPRQDRAALERACSAACRRLGLREVRLSYFPVPARVRWKVGGMLRDHALIEKARADGLLTAEMTHARMTELLDGLAERPAALGRGMTADEAVAALIPVKWSKP